MPKTKKLPKLNEVQLAESAAAPAAPWFRETVESIVIAFVLAFLFRTFEAEAFVIPTGSMAPTLMGRHKDVYCTQCGHRFQVTASDEESARALNARAQGGRQAARGYECVAGVCPMCRYTMPMQKNIPEAVLADYPVENIKNQKSYNGDRILVNKYIYTLEEPQRWDIVVFHFPGDAETNYIKRLVGLPGETLRVFQGDLFTTRTANPTDADFQIEHKPADKALAMRQLVHDTNYDPTTLYKAGWPLRWDTDESSGDWKKSADDSGQNVAQRFTVDSTGTDTAWIRYRNFVPDYRVWQDLVVQQRAQENGGQAPKLADEGGTRWRPQLVMDFNAYNSRVTFEEAQQTGSLRLDVPHNRVLAPRLGIHWVGDLMVEAEVDIEEARGELVLDLVEGGQHFTCTIDLSTGEAKLGAGGVADFAPTAKTILKAPGSYRVGLANFDDQLLLFVKESSYWMPEFRAGDVVKFDGGTAYDAELVFGNRSRILPETSAEDPGDLAPAGVGARGAKLAVKRLQVWRDIYYVADRAREDRFGGRAKEHSGQVSDIDWPGGYFPTSLPYDPALWPRLLDRRMVEFPLKEDQFFVMGDNSPESQDARLWCASREGLPGGEYLERHLLIGKALCVYWPHSWYGIPGTPVPLFPNFRDMRLVR